MIANFGRFSSVRSPRFVFVASCVITHEFDDSLPAAAIVSTTPNGVVVFGFALPENFRYPYAALIRYAMRDRLAGIDARAAADCENEIHLLASGQLNSAINQRVARIRLHAAELNMRNSGRIQRFFHPVDQSRAHRRAAAIVNQRLRAALRAHLIAHLILHAAAEHESRRHLIGKIDHSVLPS